MRFQSAGGEALADRHILERGAVNQFRRAVARRFAGQHHLNRFVILAHDLGHHSERVGEFHGFQILVNRRVGEELKFQGIEAGLGIFAQALAIWLRRLFRQANQFDGDVE